MIKTQQEAISIGRKGGNITFKRHGKKHMQEIAKKGAEARWKNYYKKHPKSR